MSTPRAFVDTETTGVHPGRRAWEVAVIRRDDEGQREWLWQVADVDLSGADPAGLKVGGFYERHLPTARPSVDAGAWITPRLRPEAEVAREVEQVTRGAQIVGAVPSFDTITLDAMLRRHRLIPAWHHRLRCVESLTAGHLRAEIGGLRACAQALEIEVDPQAEHTALGDARTAMAIWDAVMEP